MKQENINLIMHQYKDSIKQSDKMTLHQALTQASDDAVARLSYTKIHDPILILLISIFVGSLGVDRFILGDIGLGICKLLFGWVTFGIWPLIDIFFCYQKAKEINLQNILEALRG